jgi:hypothetical protein
MTRPPIFRGKILRGKIVLDNRDRFRELLESFEGKRIEIVLRERSVERSDGQNKYYHAVVVKILADHLGYSSEEMHEALKKQFNVESTAKLKTSEFTEYIQQVVRWAAVTFSLMIPDPTQIDY